MKNLFVDAASWCRREFSPANRAPVDVLTLQHRLGTVQEPDVLAAMERVADLMVSEAADRSTALDTKAISILGWTSATAVLFLTRTTEIQELPAVGIWFGSAAACLAVFSSFQAIRARKVSVINPNDWVAMDHDALLQEASLYRRYQLKNMAHIYNVQDEVNCHKAVHLHRAQWGLMVAVALMMLSLLIPFV